MAGSELSLYSQEQIQSGIFTVRGVQVIRDRDLALYFGLETKRINEQVKRNIDRFPEDFVFQLTKEEDENSRSQNATMNGEIMRVTKKSKRT